MKKSLVLLGALMMPLLSIAQLPAVQSISNTRFIEGGVGLDESEAIQMDLKNWPLLIELSSLLAEIKASVAQCLFARTRVISLWRV